MKLETKINIIAATAVICVTIFFTTSMLLYLNMPVQYVDLAGNCTKVIMPDEDGNTIEGDCDNLPKKYTTVCH